MASARGMDGSPAQTGDTQRRRAKDQRGLGDYFPALTLNPNEIIEKIQRKAQDYQDKFDLEHGMFDAQYGLGKLEYYSKLIEYSARNAKDLGEVGKLLDDLGYREAKQILDGISATHLRHPDSVTNNQLKRWAAMLLAVFNWIDDTSTEKYCFRLCNVLYVYLFTRQRMSSISRMTAREKCANVIADFYAQGWDIFACSMKYAKRRYNTPSSYAYDKGEVVRTERLYGRFLHSMTKSLTETAPVRHRVETTAMLMRVDSILATYLIDRPDYVADLLKSLDPPSVRVLKNAILITVERKSKTSRLRGRTGPLRHTGSPRGPF